MSCGGCVTSRFLHCAALPLREGQTSVGMTILSEAALKDASVQKVNFIANWTCLGA
jgi:hypothetical protein